MKKGLIIAVVLLCLYMVGCAWAEEAELKEMFLEQLEKGELTEFYCADFDVNGREEAFAVVKVADVGVMDKSYSFDAPDENGKVVAHEHQETSDAGEFELWFVTHEGSECISSEIVFESAEIIGERGPLYFYIEYYWYGLKGSNWYVNGNEASWFPIQDLEIVGGDVKLREEPNLEGKIIGYLEEGTRKRYSYEISTDERGVDWYRVHGDDQSGWVSSKYAEFVVAE